MAWRVTMAETPKKIIECEYKCFLCDTLTQSSAGKVRIFRKNAVELPRLIETAICENISKHGNSGSELFICNAKCCKRLQRLEKQRRIWKASKRRSVGFTNP